MLREPRKPSFLLALLAFSAALALTQGCAAQRPGQLSGTSQRVEIDRFKGDWFVIAHIPIDLPFSSEAQAHDAVESYRMRDDGIIETTYRYKDGGFEGPQVELTPRAWVHDETTNSEWRMQFLWPFRSAYLIAYVDEHYEDTVIGVPSRRYVWVMSRSAEVTDAKRGETIERLIALGYDPDTLAASLRWVPHSGATLRNLAVED